MIRDKYLKSLFRRSNVNLNRHPDDPISFVKLFIILLCFIEHGFYTLPAIVWRLYVRGKRWRNGIRNDYHWIWKSWDDHWFRRNESDSGSTTEEAVDDLAEEMELLTMKKSQKYKKYGQVRIERFLHVKQEQGLSLPKAAELCGIPRSTAHELINGFNASDGSVLPGNNPRRTNNKSKKLFSKHSAFLIDLFDKNPSTVLGRSKSQTLWSIPLPWNIH